MSRRFLLCVCTAAIVAVMLFLFLFVPQTAQAARGLFPIEGWFASNVASRASASQVRTTLQVFTPIQGSNIVLVADQVNGTMTIHGTATGSGGSGLWEEDENGDAMPALAGGTDANWELDGNGDLQPIN